MTTVLSSEMEERVTSIIKNAERRVRRLNAREHNDASARAASRLRSERLRIIERRRRRRYYDKRVARAVMGLKKLFELGQSESIQSLIRFEASHRIHREWRVTDSEFCFYKASSANTKAPDCVAILMHESGIALWGGCPAADDFKEAAFFPYAASDEECRRILSRHVNDHTDEAFGLLDRQHQARWDWGISEREIGFQVFIDCGDPDKFARYIDVALRRYRRNSKAA